jgi:hypothetical protein
MLHAAAEATGSLDPELPRVNWRTYNAPMRKESPVGDPLG